MKAPSTPDMGVHGHLVPRNIELQLVLEELRARREQLKRARSVLVLHAPTGIGKTQFIRKILLPYLEQSEEFAGWPRAVVNFDDDYEDAYRGPLRRGRLIIDLTRKLYQSVGQPPPRSYLDAEKAWNQKAKSAGGEQLRDLEEELVGQFNTEVIRALLSDPEGAPRPALIILDTVEQVGYDFLQWIQNSLLDPTIRFGRVVWLLASQTMVTPTPLVEDAFYHHRLAPFRRREIEQQAPEHADIARILEQFGQGHPDATNSLVEAVEALQEQIGQPLDEAQLASEHSDYLIQSLASLLNQKRYLGQLDSNSQLRPIIDLLSPLRMFDLSLLTDLLAKFLPEYLDRETVLFDPVLVARQLLGSRLVAWDKSRRGYVFEAPLRSLIAQVFEHDRPALFEDVHRWALSQYQDWFERKPRKRLDGLVEALYHRAVIARRWEQDAEPVETLLQSLQGAVGRLAETTNADTAAALDELRNQIDNDADLERELGPALKRLTDFLEEEIGRVGSVLSPTKPTP